MEYAREGNLHDYLQKNFFKITWYRKIEILKQISRGYLYLLNTFVLLVLIVKANLFYVLGLKLFMKQVLYIVISIVEIYY